MGSYASLYYYDEKNECHFVALFNHKFFGYIDDMEIVQTWSYKYLYDICEIDWQILNESYIGTVCKLNPREAEHFMSGYAQDYWNYMRRNNATFKYDGWTIYEDLANLPHDLELMLSFD